MNHENDQLLPYATIVAATAGDTEAITAVLEHYHSYIKYLACRPFFDEYGSCYVFSDDTIAQRLEAKLMAGILKFSAV